MKNIILIIITILIGFVLYVNYLEHFSKKAINGNENIIHLKKVKVGMSKREIFSIMGHPDTIFKDKYTTYCYDINDESYGYGQIVFDSTLVVYAIFFP